MLAKSSSDNLTKTFVFIPARYGSTRLKAKPLAPIAGVPMILHLVRNLAPLKESGVEVFVVTDHPEIEQVVKAQGGDVIRVDDDVLTGSERVALAYQKLLTQRGLELSGEHLVINVQGDEPLIEAQDIARLVQFHRGASYEIATLFFERQTQQSLEHLEAAHTVKIALNPTNGQCHYFSRSPIPFDRSHPKGLPKKWWQHVGIYSFRPQALLQLVKAPVGYCEAQESLEQLRALDLGMHLGACAISHELVSVDVASDITLVESILARTANPKAH